MRTAAGSTTRSSLDEEPIASTHCSEPGRPPVGRFVVSLVGFFLVVLAGWAIPVAILSEGGNEVLSQGERVGSYISMLSVGVLALALIGTRVGFTPMIAMGFLFFPPVSLYVVVRVLWRFCHLPDRRYWDSR